MPGLPQTGWQGRCLPPINSVDGSEIELDSFLIVQYSNHMLEQLIAGQPVWICGSGPTLDEVDPKSIQKPAFVLNSVVRYFSPAPERTVWAVLDRSEIRRHGFRPACAAGLLSPHAHMEAERKGFDMGSMVKATKEDGFAIGPGTVSLCASACVKYGAAAVTFVGFGGVGFAKCLGEPYSKREYGPVEKSFFPTQIETAKELLDTAGIPWSDLCQS